MTRFEITADTDGVPIGPVDCRLDNADASGVGELLLRGPDLFLGYLDASLNADAFTDDGFFRTGDLASIAASGAVTIRGRHKDIIVRGGENISAKEVEDVLFEHPAVSEVAVVAMPDPVMVERSCAFVVPKEGATVSLAVVGRVSRRSPLGSPEVSRASRDRDRTPQDRQRQSAEVRPSRAHRQEDRPRNSPGQP